MFKVALTCCAGGNAGSPAAGLVARHKRDCHLPRLQIFLHWMVLVVWLLVGFGVRIEIGSNLVRVRGSKIVNLSTAGLLSVLMVVGIGPGGVVSEYMCHSGSTTASRRPRTVPRGRTIDPVSTSTRTIELLAHP